VDFVVFVPFRIDVSPKKGLVADVTFEGFDDGFAENHGVGEVEREDGG
jgi:hypothetical protein